jgi:hypothetical protein
MWGKCAGGPCRFDVDWSCGWARTLCFYTIFRCGMVIFHCLSVDCCMVTRVSSGRQLRDDQGYRGYRLEVTDHLTFQN